MKLKNELKTLVLLVAGILLFLLPTQAQVQSTQKPGMSVMPKPRPVAAAERKEIARILSKRFKVKVDGELAVHAAGPFRFAGNKDLLYIDRTDLGSVAFETAPYGVSDKALEPSQITKEALLPHIEAVVREAGFEVQGYRFASFQDEFAGAAPVKDLPRDFDPRRASTHVARTASYERVVEDIPVFGSELVVGLNPDGSIGRFRLHWPRLNPALVRSAHRLQRAVREKKWTMPKILQDKDTEILDVSAGVGHSAFADPKFRVTAVVRVLYRKGTRETQYPIFSTTYKYFDASGREILFSAFPKIVGTPAEQKQKD